MSTIEGQMRHLNRALIVAFHRMVRALRIDEFTLWLAERLR